MTGHAIDGFAPHDGFSRVIRHVNWVVRRQTMDSTAAIKTAIQSLLVQPDDACAFVIIENTVLKKFVQFFGSLNRPLLLDLPAQTLSETEFY